MASVGNDMAVTGEPKEEENPTAVRPTAHAPESSRDRGDTASGCGLELERSLHQGRCALILAGSGLAKPLGFVLVGRALTIVLVGLPVELAGNRIRLRIRVAREQRRGGVALKPGTFPFALGQLVDERSENVE